MARQTITKLLDDIDGGEAQETVAFGLDGYHYEIDLSNKNASKLRNALALYVANGTRISGRGSAASRGARARGTKAGTDRDQNAAIRTWAQRKGYEVAARGRIKQEIIEQYHREAGR